MKRSTNGSSHSVLKSLPLDPYDRKKNSDDSGLTSTGKQVLKRRHKKKRRQFLKKEVENLCQEN